MAFPHQQQNTSHPQPHLPYSQEPNPHDHSNKTSQDRRRNPSRYACGSHAANRTGAGVGRTPYGAALLFIILSVLGTVVPGRALCEDRCERVVPMLSHLRALWSRSFKRVGEKRVSFEEFMVSLVQASSNTGHSRAHRLGNALLNLISQYQDCVMACEHPFSKRDATAHPSFQQLCNRIHSKGHGSPLFQELCVPYGP